MIKNIKAETLIYTGLICLSLYICLASILNPFGYTNVGWDTSIYLTITQGITRGQVPFRDFYDNKGPLLYLISAPGFALGRFTGVWITELIFMCISIFFAYKTALFFGNRVFALIGVILSFIVFLTFFYEAAGTEEYSLPFMMISLHIFTKHYFAERKASPPEIMILGFCFASSVLIRINMFPLWLGFCMVIFIETIIERDFSGLVKYMLLFCTGSLIIAIPVILYLKTNNALMDYIQQNFFAGSSRGFSGLSFKLFIKSFFMIINKNFCFTPLLAGFIWIVKDFAGEKRGYYAGYSISFILTVIFYAVIRTNYDHYNMSLIPFLGPAFIFFGQDIYKYFRNINNNKLCFALFLCILFSGQLVTGLNRSLFGSLIDNQSRKDNLISGRTIDEQTVKGNKIIFLGFPCHIYLFTQRDTASRYIYQTSGVDYEPNAQNEFLMDIYRNRPAIIAIANMNGHYDYLPDWYAPVYDMIDNEYQMITDENGYFLFKRIQAGNG